MDVFVVIVFGSLLLFVLLLLALGRGSQGKPIGEILDKKANEKWAAQAQIEESEVPHMVDSANERRRQKGLEERTAADYGQISGPEDDPPSTGRPS